MSREAEKREAARRSIEFVREGDVVGLGTGSTAGYAIAFLAERVRAGMNIRAIATSERTARIAADLGIELISFEATDGIDVTIDGADQVGPRLELIKGHGGALLREKIVASASRKVIIIADSTKEVTALDFPLPIEVIRFAQGLLAQRVAACGGSAALRVDREGRPFVTDEGNHILDCDFGPIHDPAQLADELDHLPGVIEHGLFLDLADVVLIGRGNQVHELYRPDGPRRTVLLTR